MPHTHTHTYIYIYIYAHKWESHGSDSMRVGMQESTRKTAAAARQGRREEELGTPTWAATIHHHLNDTSNNKYMNIQIPSRLRCRMSTDSLENNDVITVVAYTMTPTHLSVCLSVYGHLCNA
eukprot:GHVU01196101.1.p3 GENE.GHVU01196101.1~~GHVU01196101.1.p3  ORF type:complete len:122 (-),score=15.57 GHVU01196101.1:42-407(-)